MRSPTYVLTEPQREGLNEAYAQGLAALRIEAPMRASEWANAHFYLSPEASAIEGRFECWPTQVGMLDVMGNDAVRVVTVIKAARLGYTKCLAAVDGYFHEHKRRNVVIFLPTDDEAKKFAKGTTDPMIRDVPILGELLASSGRNNKENTLREKYFHGSALDIRGGKSAGNYRALTKDVAIFDEIDGFDSDIEGEGDPLSLGDKRIADSPFPKSIRGSTPTIAGSSMVERSAGEADIVFRYLVPCKHCDEAQAFEWGGPETPHGMKWAGDDPDTAHYVCRACGESWFYSDLWDLLNGGRWESDDGHYLDDESDLRNPAGKLVDFPRHVAFYIWSAYSLMFPWPDIVHEFIESKEDAVKLKAFVNTRLGETWKEEVQEVEHEPLYARRELYDAVPDEVVVLTAGIDVQADRFEFEVVGWGAGEQNWSIDYQIVPGEMQRPKVWATLLDMLKETYVTESGHEIRIAFCCMDSGYLSDEVYAFSRKAGIRWLIPVKGSSQRGMPIASMPRKPNVKRVYLTPIGTDNAKETLYQRLLLENPGPGYCHFPERDEYDDEFFRQLTGEVKRPHKVQGRTVLWWTQKYPNVEVLDCRVYALAAVKILQQRFNLKLDKPAPRTRKAEPKPKAQRPAPRRNFATDWRQ